MKVQLVTDPAHVVMDASVHPWTARLKYGSVAELLYDYEASNADIGREHCRVSDYLRAHLKSDIIDVEEHIYSHPEWGPTVLCESLFRTLMFNNETSHEHGLFIAGWAQHYLALNLVRYHPYDRARGPLEAALKHWQMRFASPAAAYVILAYINAGHPNPRRFLEKPAVRAKFPAELDVAAFRAPDFDAQAA